MEKNICVFCDGNSADEIKTFAKQKAEALNLPYEETKDFTYSLYLCFDGDGISLCDAELSVTADFTRVQKRIENSRYKNEMLYKASKFKNKDGELTAIDATAGFGEDSAILAASGYRVTLYERDKIIATLLEDAIRRAMTKPGLCDIVSRMTLICADSIEALNNMQSSPTLVLLDPMFPERQKSAKVKKKFQLLQKLESPCSDGEALLNAAIKAHPERIVIKRPAKGQYLADIKPSYSLFGDSVRYDCIVPDNNT